MNVGRVLGVILIIAGLLVFVVGAAASLTSARTTGGRAVGLAISAVLAAPLAGIGVFMLIRGQREEAAMAIAQQQKKILGMVRAQGRVGIAEAALDLGVGRDQIKDYVYDLVEKRLFTGYINWDDGDLISVDAAKMETNKCPHCGGGLELAGKGVVECPYCGAEIFLS
jgi:DNA-directed RNA polymerase subunit RPC12/RpoP